MRTNWTDDRMDDLVTRVDAGFATVEKRFEQIDKRFEQIDKRFEQIDKRFEQQRAEFADLNKRIDRFGIAMVAGLFGIVAALIAS